MGILHQIIIIITSEFTDKRWACSYLSPKIKKRSLLQVSPLANTGRVSTWIHRQTFVVVYLSS